MILPAVVANVPLFVTLPNRSSVPLVPIVNEAPALIVIFLAVPVFPLRFGILGAPDGIVTSAAEVGIPPHQLDAVFQSALVTPIQVCPGLTVIMIAFDVAVDCVTQLRELVITTVTTSLLARVAF